MSEIVTSVPFKVPLSFGYWALHVRIMPDSTCVYKMLNKRITQYIPSPFMLVTYLQIACLLRCYNLQIADLLRFFKIVVTHKNI